MFSVDQVGKIWKAEYKVALTDRQNYEKVYDLIELYISKYDEKVEIQKRVMIGGTIGVNLLLSKERSLDDYVYELYTESSFYHATNLSNEIAKIYPLTKEPVNEIPMIIYMKTQIANRNYIIYVDSRPMVYLTNLGRPRSSGEDKISLVSIINPILMPTFNGKCKVLVLSPEMELIDIYRTLYSPNRAEEWEIALHNENQLFKYLLPRLEELKDKGRVGSEVGGREEIKIDQNMRKRIQLLLLKNFIQDNPNIVLIGEHALSLIKEEKNVDTYVLQIISNNIDKDVEKISMIINTVARDVAVIKSTRQLYIMQDYQILRTIIKIGDKADVQKEIIYIYNSALYDLTPVNRIITPDKHYLQIGNPFVLLRFLLIDLWMLLWITELGGIDKNYSKQRQDAVMEKILTLRSTMSGDILTTIGKHEKSLFHIFQDNPDDYVGQYEDEVLSQKIAMTQNKDKKVYHKDYYPQDYYNKNGEYRTIGYNRKN